MQASEVLDKVERRAAALGRVLAKAERKGLDSDYWLGVFQDRAGDLGFDQDAEWQMRLEQLDQEMTGQSGPPGEGS